MQLDRLKIEEEILRPSKGNQIHAAIDQQERIKFHTDTSLESVQSASYTHFKNFVKSILPEDKLEVTMNLLKFPIPTNELTEKVFTKLGKIFDGRNPAFNYQFTKTEYKEDWERYRQEELNEPEVWANKAFDYFKTEINCVMVVDMPKDGESMDGRPRPYFYFVPITSVKSYRVNEQTGNMDWIIFESNGTIVVIDGYSYKTYEYENQQLGDILSDNPHGLDYCPARFFWTEPLSLSDPDVKRSPLSKELSNLDWYLFKLLGKRHLETYASYPIYSGFEEECSYTDGEGNYCNHGHLCTPEGTFLTDVSGNPVVCPICHGKKQLAGAGSYITVPIPEEGQPDLRRPIDILTIDRQSLDYNQEELERLKTRIISSCVGTDNSILNELSVTDKQVDASYESQDSVLNRVKKGFETAQKFIDDTCCRLRYGSDFRQSGVNYGTEFYTLTPEVLRNRYKKAKDGGATDSELDAIRQQILETEYRHNPLMLQRMIILSDLEPFCHSTKEECLRMYEKGIISKDEFSLKYDFSNYIRKFERENDNITEFGRKLPYDKKISTIYKELLKYARERIGTAPQGELPAGTGERTPGPLQD